MPLTFAHPAIVIPLSKSRFNLSLTALVVGSMAPDFEFVFRLRELENVGHDWFAIMLFNMPISLLFCYLFHNVLRDHLIVNLPEVYRVRFFSQIRFDWNRYARLNLIRITISILLGIASHYLWDAFSHQDGAIVQLVPFLEMELNILFGEVSFYFLLQIIFSLIGLIMIHIWIVKLPAQTCDSESHDKRPYWMLFSFIYILLLCLRLILMPSNNTVEGIIIALAGCVFYSCIFVSLIFILKPQLKTANYEYQ